MIFFSNKTRPFHYGAYPLERLKRDANIINREEGLPVRVNSSGTINKLDWSGQKDVRKIM